MNTYLTISDQAIGEATFRVPSTTSLATIARALQPATFRTAQPSDIGTVWPSAGVMPVRTRAAQQHQGGRIAGAGGCDVTDPKFSTRVGPPSCRPPV